MCMHIYLFLDTHVTSAHMVPDGKRHGHGKLRWASWRPFSRGFGVPGHVPKKIRKTLHGEVGVSTSWGPFCECSCNKSFSFGVYDYSGASFMETPVWATVEGPWAGTLARNPVGL